MPLIIKCAKQIGKTNAIKNFVRDTNSLILVEVKVNDNRTASINNLVNSDKYKDIKYEIKLYNKNIGFNGKFYTFLYFLAFLLKKYLKEK